MNNVWIDNWCKQAWASYKIPAQSVSGTRWEESPVYLSSSYWQTAHGRLVKEDKRRRLAERKRARKKIT